MKNKRERHQSGSPGEEVDENENRPAKMRNEMEFFKYSENNLLRGNSQHKRW
nr:unnamed protein product [Callosobruchus analis]